MQNTEKEKEIVISIFRDTAKFFADPYITWTRGSFNEYQTENYCILGGIGCSYMNDPFMFANADDQIVEMTSDTPVTERIRGEKVLEVLSLYLGDEKSYTDVTTWNDMAASDVDEVIEVLHGCADKVKDGTYW